MAASASAQSLPDPTALPRVPLPVPTVPAVPVPTVVAPVTPRQLPAAPTIHVAPAPAPVTHGSGNGSAPASPSTPATSGAPARRSAGSSGASGASGQIVYGAQRGSASAGPGSTVHSSRLEMVRDRRDRRLRRNVVMLRGCLGGLARTERRVLVLRAGLGQRRPRARARVAGILDVPARRVARIERRALRHLKTLGEQDCGATRGGASASAGNDGATDFALASAGEAAAADGSGDLVRDGGNGSSARDQSEVKSEHAESRNKPAQPRGFGGIVVPRGNRAALIFPLGLAALALIGGVVFLLARRRQRIKRYEPYY
jgi:Sigma-70, region 4